MVYLVTLSSYLLNSCHLISKVKKENKKTRKRKWKYCKHVLKWGVEKCTMKGTKKKMELNVQNLAFLEIIGLWNKISKEKRRNCSNNFWNKKYSQSVKNGGILCSWTCLLKTTVLNFIPAPNMYLVPLVGKWYTGIFKLFNLINNVVSYFQDHRYSQKRNYAFPLVTNFSICIKTFTSTNQIIIIIIIAI